MHVKVVRELCVRISSPWQIDSDLGYYTYDV